MSYVKDYRKSTIYLYHEGLVKRLCEMEPNSSHRILFASEEDAAKFRKTLYGFISAFFGKKKFRIKQKGSILVISYSMVLYEEEEIPEEGMDRKGGSIDDKENKI